MSDDRQFFTLQAHVRGRGSAELLTVSELIKLGESCEPPPDDAGAWQWMQDIGKPLIRELATRLAKKDNRGNSNYSKIISTARRLRSAEDALRKEKNAANRRSVVALQRQLDQLLSEHGQLSLWEEEA